MTTLKFLRENLKSCQKNVNPCTTLGCLNQHKISFNHGKVVNLYIAYELSLRPSNFALGNRLLGTAKLNKNADKYKHGYSGYSIGFNARSTFSLSNCNGFGTNVIIL